MRRLAGEELAETAEAEGLAYITVYKRYRQMLATLRRRLTDTSTAPALRRINARGTTEPGMPQPQCSTAVSTA